MAERKFVHERMLEHKCGRNRELDMRPIVNLWVHNMREALLDILSTCVWKGADCRLVAADKHEEQELRSQILWVVSS